jgi:putative ATPase
VETKNCGTVPVHLRDAHYKGASKLGHGTDYIYPHDYPGHFTSQQYLPEELSAVHYYEPSGNGEEKRLGAYLHHCWPERF